VKTGTHKAQVGAGAGSGAGAKTFGQSEPELELFDQVSRKAHHVQGFLFSSSSIHLRISSPVTGMSVILKVVMSSSILSVLLSLVIIGESWGMVGLISAAISSAIVVKNLLKMLAICFGSEMSVFSKKIDVIGCLDLPFFKTSFKIAQVNLVKYRNCYRTPLHLTLLKMKIQG
jgi:hypothetical protein